MNLYPGNKNLFAISSILYFYKILPSHRILLKGELDPNNKPLASCFLRNLDFLLPQTAQFNEIIILSFFCFYSFCVLTFSIFSTIQAIRHCFLYKLNFYLALEFLISYFILSYSFSTLFRNKFITSNIY